VFSIEMPTTIWIARDSSVSVAKDLPVIYGAKNADDLIDRAAPFLPRSAT
jgi:hypothetical protein